MESSWNESQLTLPQCLAGAQHSTRHFSWVISFSQPRVLSLPRRTEKETEVRSRAVTCPSLGSQAGWTLPLGSPSPLSTAFQGQGAPRRTGFLANALTQRALQKGPQRKSPYFQS